MPLKRKPKKRLLTKSVRPRKDSKPSSKESGVENSWLIARNEEELNQILGLSPEVVLLSQIKNGLSRYTQKLLTNTALPLKEIVRLSGVSRSKVSLMKGGSIYGISVELYLKVIQACGKRIRIEFDDA